MDDNENYYVAVAGRHFYEIKPEIAPDARILQLMPAGSTKVIYDKLVPD